MVKNVIFHYDMFKLILINLNMTDFAENSSWVEIFALNDSTPDLRFVPEYVPTQVKQLIVSCCQQVPRGRPTFAGKLLINLFQFGGFKDLWNDIFSQSNPNSF